MLHLSGAYRSGPGARPARTQTPDAPTPGGAPVRRRAGAGPGPPRRTRALARDGETFAPHWDRWAAQEEDYLARHAPRAAADLILRLPSA